MDYKGNSNKDKEKEEKEQPKPKELKKIVTGEVTTKKKGIGRKFKDLIVEADFRSVIGYIMMDILIPAAKNMIVDSAAKGAERMVYGDSGGRRRIGGGSRISYDRISRSGVGGSPLRGAPAIERGVRTTRQTREDYIISSRKEAEEVLEMMTDVIDNYEVVSVSDLNELVGYPSSHVDNKWGWTFLGDVQIRQIREGYLLDLPPAEPIQ